MYKFFLTTLLSLLCLSLWAEVNSGQAPAVTPLPQDSALRYGKLDNGLTYYVRKNSFIPGRASFYIAQNVGSILEEPSQRGLAHFLEHMAFNGTVHFPDKAIINYLETIGVKFGANLNAYTGIDETVYTIKDVPVERESVVDSCLLILRDWSDGISLEAEEIDKERAVIEEEWRTRNNGMQRMLEEVAPKMYMSDKYSDCLPIGSMDVVRNFDYSVLRDYYHKWYRPDLQAIIVVGDLNADDVVAKIKNMFGDCKLPKDASERIWYPVSDNDSLIIVSSTDKEVTTASVMLFQKRDIFPFALRSSVEYFAENYIRSLVGIMVNQRFSEILQAPEPPFIMGNYYVSQFLISKTKDAETFEFYCDPSKLDKCLARLLEERKRIKRYGFTQGELQRAKDELLMSYTELYNEREHQRNDYYMQKYVDNFTSGIAASAIDVEYQLAQLLSQAVSLEMINGACVNDYDANMLLWITAPENFASNIPSNERVGFLLDSVNNAQLESYMDDFEYKPLVTDVPGNGEIMETSYYEFGVVKYTLSNGVEVYVKPTDFKSDEILISACGKGGKSLESLDDAITMNFLSDIAAIGGLGDFSAVELEKQLSGKRLDYNMSVDVYKQSMTGNSDVKSLETLLQLFYLQFTSLREDSVAFSAYMDRVAGVLKNVELYPAVTFADSVISAVYDDHPFAKQLKFVDLDKVSYKKGVEILRRRFANAAAFDFVIVGNVDTISLKPLLCKYLATLPASSAVDVWQNCGFVPVPGERYVRYEKPMKDPKTSVSIVLSGEMPYTLKNKMALQVFENVIDIVYTATVREEEGGTYGVSTNTSLEKEPVEHFEFHIKFDSDSAKVDRLLPIIMGEIKNIADNGPSAENLQKVKEYMTKVYVDNQEQNGYWLGVVNELLLNEVNIQNAYIDTLNSIDAEAVKEIARVIYESGNYKEIVQIGVGL